MPRSPVSLSAYVNLVRTNRNFRLLWSAQIVSEIGDWLYTIAVYSLLLKATGKAQSVALAVVLQVLPQVLISPAAGVINDRLSRRSVMIFADIVRCFIVLAMFFVIAYEQIWPIYVLLFLETTMWGLFEPGRSAVIPSITRGDQVLVANALSSTTWSFNLAVGATLGGLVAVAAGRDIVLLLNALTFLVSALLLRAMRFEERHLEGGRKLRLRDLLDYRPVVEGIGYLRGDRQLLATLLVKGGLGVMGSSWVILPIYGERIFPVSGPNLDHDQSVMLGMSLLMGARGIGALLGPLISGYWAGFEESRLRLGILFGFIAGALGYFGLGAAPSLLLACSAVVLSHAGGSTVWVFSTTLLQIRSDDRFRGRVFSADYAFLVLTMSAVTYLAGMAVDWGVPVRTLALVTGVLAIAPVFGWSRAMTLWREHPPSLPADHRNL